MDKLKLFALLVAVAVIKVNADAPKKKIRIHLPQRVKHIHHHKKIYITNHPATSQYAPAFMPSAEGAVAVPTNIGVPAIAKVLSPYNSVELYDELPTRPASSSKLLPLYRARGHYGPAPSEWGEPEDLASPDQGDAVYVPTAFEPPSPTPLLSHTPKRVKIIKLDDPPKKKTPKKTNSKRVVVRNKPQIEEEHPVSTFHEKFYADLDGSGATIRKIKKPQRIEKIIDGDTEHIHTYSEEHIHKLVFNDGTRMNGVVGMDPTALASSHSILPVKSSQALLTINGEQFAGYNAVGSINTPNNFEYAAYNPREVTHDHIFHDHGEIPSDLDITKDPISYPPKYSYTGHGFRIGVGRGTKGHKNKHPQHYIKPAKATQLTDYSYYDDLNPYNKGQNWQKPTITTQFESAHDASEDNYRPTYKPKEKTRLKSRNVVPALHFDNGKQVTDHRLQQTPYAVSSTVVHDYNPDLYLEQISGSGPTGSSVSNYNKDLYNYPKSESYDLDQYTLSSSSYGSGIGKYRSRKGKKKSISTQNISFGGLDHQTTVDHLDDSDASASSISAVSAPESYNGPPSTAFTIKETSPVHSYYAAMAIKALNGDQLSKAEASNDNFQYAEPPPPSPSAFSESTTVAPTYYEIVETETMTTETPELESTPRFVAKDADTVVKEPKKRYKILALHTAPTQTESRHSASRINDASSSGSKPKYGDKI